MSTVAAQSFNGNLKKAVAGIRRINLEGLRWRVFDAKGQVLGRLASQVSTVVQGKDKPTYAPNRDDGDMCIILNAKDICVTGRKLTDKFYRWHTGYVGHLKERSLKDQMAKDPTEVIRKAVLRMLPRNKLRDDRDRKLRIFPGSEHPFGDKPLEPFVMPPRQVREMRPRARRAMVRAQKKAEQQEGGKKSSKGQRQHSSFALNNVHVVQSRPVISSTCENSLTFTNSVSKLKADKSGVLTGVSHSLGMQLPNAVSMPTIAFNKPVPSKGTKVEVLDQGFKESLSPNVDVLDIRRALSLLSNNSWGLYEPDLTALDQPHPLHQDNMVMIPHGMQSVPQSLPLSSPNYWQTEQQSVDPHIHALPAKTSNPSNNQYQEFQLFNRFYSNPMDEILKPL